MKNIYSVKTQWKEQGQTFFSKFVDRQCAYESYIFDFHFNRLRITVRGRRVRSDGKLYQDNAYYEQEITSGEVPEAVWKELENIIEKERARDISRHKWWVEHVQEAQVV